MLGSFRKLTCELVTIARKIKQFSVDLFIDYLSNNLGFGYVFVESVLDHSILLL